MFNFEEGCIVEIINAGEAYENLIGDITTIRKFVCVGQTVLAEINVFADEFNDYYLVPLSFLRRVDDGNDPSSWNDCVWKPTLDTIQ